MAKKLALSVVCGGQSTEHEVSINSVKNIVAELDPSKYDVSVVYIDQQGKWYFIDNIEKFLSAGPDCLLSSQCCEPITLTLGHPRQPFLSLKDPKRHFHVDCIFPMVHGTTGEDGALQGLIELLGLPYVGADVQSSALCMDKDVAKQLLRFADIPTLDWHTVYPHDRLNGLYDRLAKRFGPELFVKPASLGSSVASSPVVGDREFTQAVEHALRFDERVMVEPRLHAREIECAVLGNGEPKASLPGEIITSHDFYSYEAKYLDPEGAKIDIPVNLPDTVIEEIRAIAVAAFKALHCDGMARVDFFVVNDREVFVNELNTLPGFTNISMYPKMWQASGLPYGKLLDALIDLSLRRYQEQQQLIRCYRVEE